MASYPTTCAAIWLQNALPCTEPELARMEFAIRGYINKHTERLCVECMWPALGRSNELFSKLAATKISSESNPIRQHDLEQIKRSLYKRATAFMPLWSVSFGCDSGHGLGQGVASAPKRPREDGEDEDMPGRTSKISCLPGFRLPIQRNDAATSTNTLPQRPASAFERRAQNHDYPGSKQVEASKATSEGAESMGARLEAFVKSQVSEQFKMEKLRWEKEQADTHAEREEALIARERSVAEREEDIDRRMQDFAREQVRLEQRTRETDETAQTVKALRMSLEDFEETLSKRKKDVTEQQKKLLQEREGIRAELLASAERIMHS